jgi:hypothetical protein
MTMYSPSSGVPAYIHRQQKRQSSSYMYVTYICKSALITQQRSGADDIYCLPLFESLCVCIDYWLDAMAHLHNLRHTVW